MVASVQLMRMESQPNGTGIRIHGPRSLVVGVNGVHVPNLVVVANKHEHVLIQSRRMVASVQLMRMESQPNETVIHKNVISTNINIAAGGICPASLAVRNPGMTRPPVLRGGVEMGLIVLRIVPAPIVYQITSIVMEIPIVQVDSARKVLTIRAPYACPWVILWLEIPILLLKIQRHR